MKPGKVGNERDNEGLAKNNFTVRTSDRGTGVALGPSKRGCN